MGRRSLVAAALAVRSEVTRTCTQASAPCHRRGSSVARWKPVCCNGSFRPGISAKSRRVAAVVAGEIAREMERREHPRQVNVIGQDVQKMALCGSASCEVRGRATLVGDTPEEDPRTRATRVLNASDASSTLLSSSCIIDDHRPRRSELAPSVPDETGLNGPRANTPRDAARRSPEGRDSCVEARLHPASNRPGA